MVSKLIKINQNLNNCGLNFKEELEWLQKNKCSRANDPYFIARTILEHQSRASLNNS